MSNTLREKFEYALIFEGLEPFGKHHDLLLKLLSIARSHGADVPNPNQKENTQ